ncbi:MAG: hypothetical protein IPK19_18110 [Chloroflexi bacterium]|nr:hypothetical protein [Chloroflexota bacterium]
MLFVLPSAAACMCCSILFLSALRERSETRYDFCSTDDPVYQSILENRGEWFQFFSDPSNRRKLLTLDVPSGFWDRYDIRFADWLSDRDAGDLFLLVKVGYTWPDTPEGATGYLVRSEDTLDQDDLMPGYDVSRMTEGIYCNKDVERQD